MLTHYHNDMSTCAQKVRFALAEKGLEWDGQHLDLRALDQQKPEYLALNPNAVVPTLVHDDLVVIESTVINEYVDDAFPGPALRPSSAAERARMRLWTKKLDEGLHSATGVISTSIAFRYQARQGGAQHSPVPAEYAGPRRQAAAQRIDDLRGRAVALFRRRRDRLRPAARAIRDDAGKAAVARRSRFQPGRYCLRPLQDPSRSLADGGDVEHWRHACLAPAGTRFVITCAGPSLPTTFPDEVIRPGDIAKERPFVGTWRLVVKAPLVVLDLCWQADKPLRIMTFANGNWQPELAALAATRAPVALPST